MKHRIAYIVKGNPEGVRNLIFQHGYVPPRNTSELLQGTRELIDEKGPDIVKELIKLHPDKKAILSIGPNDSYKGCGCSTNLSYCGCNHSYEGKENSDNTTSVSVLESRYKQLVSKAGSNPEDTSLQLAVEEAWKNLREAKSEKKSVLKEHKEEIILIGVSLTIGVLIGLTLSKARG